MIKNQRNTVFALAKWLSEKYIRLEREVLPNTCKIIKIITDIKNNNKLVQVQFSGQSHVVEIDPHKIIELNLFEYFSSEDKKLIFSLGYNSQKLRLSDQYHCKITNQDMVVLTDTVTGNKLNMPAEVASTNLEIIKQISPEDANKIGFLSGMSYIKKYFKNFK